MVSSFSANFLSLLTLNVSTRCGFRPLACQIRRTVASLTPISAAMVRVLQWVALAGDDAVVLPIYSSFTRVAMAGFRPARQASFSKPANHAFKQRLDHHAYY